eukprot:COSAG04_NODE_7827_length_1061_cov_1.417879_1_plen_96_part_00
MCRSENLAASMIDLHVSSDSHAPSTVSAQPAPLGHLSEQGGDGLLDRRLDKRLNWAWAPPAIATATAATASKVRTIENELCTSRPQRVSQSVVER